MKKIIALSVLIGVTVGAAVAWAQSTVYSANIVGFVTVTINRGDIVMLRNDFIQASNVTPTPSTLLTNSLPIGSEVLIWNATNKPPKYETSVYQSIRGVAKWSTELNLARGKGFWVRVPATAPNPTYTLSFAGEVPSDTNAVVAIAEGMNMVAYAFPTSVVWTNTTLAKTAAVGDEVSLWNETTKQYDRSVLQSIRGVLKWSSPDLVIPIGRSIWYKTTKPRDWTEPKPY